MRSFLVSFIALSVGLAAGCPAKAETDPPKSACNARNHGKLWPPEANSDRAVTQKQFAAGELWMCEGNYDWDAYFPATLHFFTWKRVSVRFKAKAAGGAAAVPPDLRAEDTSPEQ